MSMGPSQTGTMSRWGPLALLGNVILVYLALVWLRRSAADPFDRVFILASANLGVACALFLPHVRGGRLFPNAKLTAALVGWSVAYCLIYGSFVRWREYIPVWGLIAAQASAPLVAVFASGDYRRDREPFAKRLLISSPIVFLLGVAASEWGTSQSGAFAPYIALALVVLFSLSQACARIVAHKAPSAAWGPPRLTFLNGFLLLIFWMIFGPRVFPDSGITLLRGALLLSVGIFVLQVLYLFALAKTGPFVSALLLSAGVPLSIFGDSLLKAGPSHPRLALWLAVCFSVATGLVTWLTSERRVAPSLASISTEEGT